MKPGESFRAEPSRASQAPAAYLNLNLNLNVNVQVPSLMHGGLSWFEDLTVPDPNYGLPVICAVVTLGMIEFVMARDPTNPMSQKKGLIMFMRVATLMIIPLGGQVPAAVGLLWLSNSLYGIFQGQLFRSEKFRSLMGLPSLQVGGRVSSWRNALLA